jgi:RimJ/RimL family protein N-acetyltransferase
MVKAGIAWWRSFKNYMVELRPFSETHLDNTFLWMQDPALRRSFLFQRKVTPQSHREWFEKMKLNPAEKLYAIIHDKQHVGNLGLKNIEPDKKLAETWIYIGDGSVQGKGVASSAYEKLFELLRSQGEIKTLYCHIASFNLASIKLYNRLGFKQVTSFGEKRDWEGEEFDLLQFNRTV